MNILWAILVRKKTRKTGNEDFAKKLEEYAKMIEEISEKEKLFTGISLSRNRGHQNALLGGLMTAKKLCWYSNKYGCRLTRWYKCNRWNDR